ncbi:unnamed protein product [Parajaminaea phylloscopi]
MANPMPTFGFLLIVFYLTGSKATKVKANVKATLERESDKNEVAAHKSATGGGRNAWQVLCNGLVGCIAALLFRLTMSPPCIPYSISLETFCPISPIRALGPVPSPRNYLILALGHFAACMGDTLASELGILSHSQPFLFFSTRPRKVPHGTNGGMSVFGTVASALGGLWIGIVFVASVAVWGPACWTTSIRSSSRARTSFLGSASEMSIQGVGWLLLLSTTCGFLGSLVDSVLGATLQKTWYNTKTRQVLLGSRKRTSGGEKTQEKDWVVVTGYDILSNNQVNLLSSLITAIAAVCIDRAVWG